MSLVNKRSVLSVVGGLLLLALAAVPFGAETAAAQSKPVLLVVAPKLVADPEYLETRKALEASGLTVEVAGVTTDIATGYGDLKVKPDVAIADAKAERYRGIAVIGGEGAITSLWDNAALHALLHDATTRDLWVAAICAAPVTLAHAGLLKGKAATAYPDDNTIAEMKKGGADYRNEPVVTDGRLVTGNGPDASAAFGKRLAELMTAG